MGNLTPFGRLMVEYFAVRGLSFAEGVERLRESGASEEIVQAVVAAVQGLKGAGSEPSEN